ncbi:MAG TPA: DUF6755 family protein [Armatimonadaceae bacterium]|nr:DUF6755 family protein [Armatimonadaceae bacterium]
MRKRFTRPQKMVIVTGILSIVFVIDILQLWLVTATMNSYLGGDSGVPVPAALFSLVCLGLNVGLLKFLYDLDRASGDPSGTREPSAPPATAGAGGTTTAARQQQREGVRP